MHEVYKIKSRNTFKAGLKLLAHSGKLFGKQFQSIVLSIETEYFFATPLCI